GADLADNARQWPESVRVVVGSVEAYLASRPQRIAPTVIVDPPRTGLSPEAAGGPIRSRPLRIVYGSCGPPTLARDARRLADAGYRLASIRAFDLFPNTPHVESLGVFER